MKCQLPKKTSSRKYFFNEAIFDRINNPEKAYWLGFLMGDGSIVNHNLVIELSNSDIDQMEKLILFFNGNNSVKETRKNCSYICFTSEYLIRSLSKYGIVPRKTYNRVKTPKMSPKYLRHFYRGLYDSDGWITEHKLKNTNKPQYEFGFSSYYPDILVEIQSFLIQQGCKSGGSLRTRICDNHQVSQLIIGGNSNFIKIYDTFYKNATIYLERKYQKSTEFYNTIRSPV